jgi:hypothetical protein
MAIKRQNLEASKTRRIRPLLGRPFGGSAWRVNAGNLLSTFSGASACLSTLFMGPIPFGGRGRGLSASPRPVVVGGRLNSRWDVSDTLRRECQVLGSSLPGVDGL